MRNRYTKYGASSIEFIAVVTFLLLTLVAFRGYIQKGFTGRWTALGDAVGGGKSYDPRGFGVNGENGGTLDCFWDTVTDDRSYNHWIDEDCYRRDCDCTLRGFDGRKLPGYDARCESCKEACKNDVKCAPH